MQVSSRPDVSNKKQVSTVVFQRTLKRSVSCVGIGLHSGQAAKLTIKPAKVDKGINFKRGDVHPNIAEIKAHWDNVVDTRMCSVIGNNSGITVSTVEHIMAALAGCGIDNAEIEVDGSEVPIMDGSSEPFVSLIKRAGVVEQNQPRRVIRICKEVKVSVGEASASLEPGNFFDLKFQIDFESEAVGRQEFSLGLMNGSFCKELASARTFGFLHEVEKMRAAGLAKGGSLDNAVVVSGDRVLNEEGLRFDNEFVRHKILDAVGDLYLAGAPIIGRFNGSRSGHAVNNALLRALFADNEAWVFDEMRGKEALTAVDGGFKAEIETAIVNS
ncbi:MAG: UDP-3-O-[3-hydroxymyristoyl] N-acetylglucosamine deacetylase [Magnetovibrio sp.]|nr:UDP-3-O-[3-hydroxymyristoyl] N-acetylglucosamine deacetylase [Magnetovibrio sp.]